MFQPSFFLFFMFGFFISCFHDSQRKEHFLVPLELTPEGIRSKGATGFQFNFRALEISHQIYQCYVRGTFSEGLQRICQS